MDLRPYNNKYYLLTFFKISCDFAGDGGTLPGARPLRPPGKQIKIINEQH